MERTRFVTISLAVSLSLFACVDGPEGPLDTSSSSHEILGGEAGEVGQFPTVVALFNNGLCTGTLIRPDVVLTAAHCITPSLLRYPDQEALSAATQVIFDRPSLFGGGGRSIGVKRSLPHPGFSVNSIGDSDIGLVWLNEPVTDRDPSIINFAHDDAPPGIVVTQVGFGATEPGNQRSAGTLYVLREKATMSCAGTGGGSDDDLLCFSQTDGTGKCEGDSGGPSFAMIHGGERVVGITSFGDQNCAQFGADTRTDAEKDFIFENVPELQCQEDGFCSEACGRGGLDADPDCDVCTDDSECEENQVCNKDGACEAAPNTPRGLGTECTNSDDCDTGLCASGPEGSRCTDFCDDSTCPSGFECLAAGSDSVCWPGADSESGGGCSTGTGTGSVFVLLMIGLAFVRRRNGAAR